MASTSFTLSNQFIGRKFVAPNSRANVSVGRPFRLAASCATAERSTHHNAVQTKALSLYDVLGVRTGATCQEIKSAYRSLARVLHPDVASSGASAADEFMRVNAAYSTLSDPEKRAAYDGSIFRPRRREATSSSYSELNRRRRTWETDQCW